MTKIVPTVELKPMTDDEFDAYVSLLAEEYARECLQSGRVTDPEKARELGREAMTASLPDGLASKDHFVYTVYDAVTDERVGSLWLALREREKLEAFIYDIRVEESLRGLGYGRATMIACIRRANELDAPSLGLHVFGHAAVPRALYASLGFIETDVIMSLPLDGMAAG